MSKYTWIIKRAESYKTMKERRNDPLYIESFVKKGNKKLTDYYNPDTEVYYKYAQFNLPARKTCPYSTEDCYKFCYAIRDERHSGPKNNRLNNFKATQTENFVERLIYTLYVEIFFSDRYKDSTMICRIHESGDFYRQKYLNDWIEAFKFFMFSDRVIFQFYTKSFKYFLDLTSEQKEVINIGLESGNIAMSLSTDKSMKAEHKNQMLKAYTEYPKANIYAAIKADRLGAYKHDSICDCADCAKCGKCIKTDSKTIACVIH